MKRIHPSQRLIVLALLVGVALPLSGCSRAYYRQQADGEVAALLRRGACDLGVSAEAYPMSPDGRSRMHDPESPDCPPMPSDDPNSHRLMHCVNCKHGWPCWHARGETDEVDNPTWRSALPLDEQGRLVLDRTSATEVALVHSREYRRELEDLYLSALDVTMERFRLDAQFFGGNNTFFTVDGPLRAGQPAGRSALQTNTDLQMKRLLATGGELTVGMANSLVWQFAGADDYGAQTLLDFSLVQPLLRASGRAIALESLTQSERNLLANIRQMERYRRGFHAQVVAGRNPGTGPSRGGLGVGSFSAGGGASVGGLLGLMQEKVRIRNQEFNVAGLRDSLAQLEAFRDADRIDVFQVDMARQALFNAQSRLLSLKAAYENRLDTMKATLGLPPDLPIVVQDPFLDRFELMSQSMTELRRDVANLLRELGDPDVPVGDDYLARLADIRIRSSEAMQEVLDEVDTLANILPERRNRIAALATRPELADTPVDQGAWSVNALNERVERLHGDLVRLMHPNANDPTSQSDLDPLPVLLDRLDTFLADPMAGTTRAGVDRDGNPKTIERVAREYLYPVSRRLLELSLVQARTRLEKVTLVEIDVTWQTALRVAREYRRDWKNARAALVDQWRQIELAGDDLRSDLDVVFSGDLNTTDDNPLRFRGTTGRLHVGLEFDAPLTRLAERNRYRERLISYQQARRQMYAFEDQVTQALRAMLRDLRLAQLNFELRRTAVSVAITQVDLTQLRLDEPPKAGAQQQFGATTARDLLQALSSLLEVQNSFLSEWVDYEVQRLNLDYDLGTMQIDAQGVWIDPGPLRESDGFGTM